MDAIKKSKETKWITTLITAYLYSLNDELVITLSLPRMKLFA